MNLLPLPSTILEFIEWDWERLSPYYEELNRIPLSADTVETFFSRWSDLRRLVDERYALLLLDNSRNTADTQAERRFHSFLESVYPFIQTADQRLKEKLLASGLEPDGMQVPLRNMQAEASLFRQENLALMTAEHKLGSEYNKIIGAQTIFWNEQEYTLEQLRPLLATPDRAQRKAIRMRVAERRLEDRAALNRVWTRGLQIRQQMAANAGYANYRDFRWQQLLRFDYTPEDCLQFHQAIEAAVVPAATRVYEKHARQMGVEHLKPWDMDQDLYPLTLPPLPPYGPITDLERKAEAVFAQVSPKLGEYFSILRRENLLDLPNRKGKAPGGYCTQLAWQKRPFIFANAVGMATDIHTVLHEAGHAFHVFERTQMPYHHQWKTGMEFAEVASMSMELLASPYLDLPGGFYSQAAANRERVEHLEKILLFWPYMAVVDAFQHWAYTHPDEAVEGEACSAQWSSLWQRFIPAVDWSGMEAAMSTAWQRKQHIFRAPFYYVEYGMAQLGAVQVWRRALEDQPAAVDAYLGALSLGGSAALPRLYAEAGARFAFDEGTLREAVELIKEKIEEIEAEGNNY